MFDRVLVAVDGSDCARRGARLGFAIAKACGATAEAVYAVETGRMGGASPELRRQRRDRGRDALDEVGEIAAEVGVGVQTHVAAGDPASVVVDRVRERGADLVVVGRHGRAALGDRLLGSVTRRVLRNAGVPVLVVPRGALVDDGQPAFEDVLAPTDGSEVAEAAAPYAADLARRHGATLHVVSAVDVQAESGMFSAGGVSEEFVEALGRRGQTAVDGFVERVRATPGGTDAADADVDVDTAATDTDTVHTDAADRDTADRDGDPSPAVRTAVLRGTPHDAIHEYVADEGVDLIVMASRGESSLAGQLLGSVADRLVRVVDVPVMVVPHPE